MQDNLSSRLNHFVEVNHMLPSRDLYHVTYLYLGGLFYPMANKFKSIKILEKDYQRLCSRGKFGDHIYSLVGDLLDEVEKREMVEKLI
jgi:hypothetical protein